MVEQEMTVSGDRLRFGLKVAAGIAAWLVIIVLLAALLQLSNTGL